jgi:TIR domain/SIR2-like domain
MGENLPVVAEGWRDRDWNKLISSVEEGIVIPVIGQDLLQVTPEGASSPIPLYRFIAERLVDEFSLPPDVSSPKMTLSDVVCRCLQDGMDSYDIRHGILGVLSKAAFAPPEPLCHLAEISGFNLFVSITFDPLMEKALENVRFGGRTGTVEVCSYDPKEPHKNEEVSMNKKYPAHPVLFHLMGKLSGGSDSVVITEEDMLEFVCALHSENRVPTKLFDELQNNHLLMLGCSFSDWLARFFLRAAKRRRLSESRPVVEFVVDDCTLRDEDLVLFLQHFSRSTRIFRSGNAIAFVKELRDRWLAHNPKAAIEAPPAAAAPQRELPDEMPEGAVFISYAREDRADVELLKSNLDTHGLPVWFDIDKLKGGDLYEKKIQRNIKTCALFLPVISARTERRTEGFFRREWKLAAKRSDDIDDRVPFIVPIAIDDTTEAAARVPDKFLDVQWERCPGGTVSAEFAQRLQSLLNLKAAPVA